jgi:hypothetical protein
MSRFFYVVLSCVGKKSLAMGHHVSNGLPNVSKDAFVNKRKRKRKTTIIIIIIIIMYLFVNVHTHQPKGQL